MSNISFSLWCDFVERDFLEGEFIELIESGIINGVTSNPAIFQQALLSKSYESQKKEIATQEPKEIYESLAKRDIQRAAEIMLPMYNKDINNGYVSIEVDPNLCDDAEGTIREGERLYKEIGYPNVMIKVPATKAGYVAIEKLISKGIPVNITLVFSESQVIECMESLKAGYETLKRDYKKDIGELPRAVISIFVSRFDRKCDEILKNAGIANATLGVKNAQKLYKIIDKYSLPAVRALFASTGVKDDTLEPSYYVEELYYPYTINTAPLNTIKAFMQARKSLQSLIENGAYLPDDTELDDYFKLVKNAGINLESVSQELLEQGLSDFKVAFLKILDSLQ